jgi:hypothetical protein
MNKEPIIEPDLPIVDAHHHLYVLPSGAITAVECVQAPGIRGIEGRKARAFQRNSYTGVSARDLSGQ